MLVKIKFRHPDVDLTNILKKLLKDFNPTPLEALVAPIVERVGQIKRVEGEHHD